METALPLRPAWVEIELGRLARNFQIIHRDKPAGLRLLSIVKDNAYGHGMCEVAKVALQQGAAFLGVISMEEALKLRQTGIEGRILMLGERQAEELPWCLEHELTVCVNELGTAVRLNELALRAQRVAPVHLKVNTGMNRYGVRWTEAVGLARQVARMPGLRFEGMMSHFCMSDESDKTFARIQMGRFAEVVKELETDGLRPSLLHHGNSGGFLDLPEAHWDMVRLGILPLGVYPSSVCRRIPGLEPVMTVKARLASIQHLQPGDTVGYGLKYQAPSPRRVAVLPIGYGDGFPRLRNAGQVLLHGRRAPIIGGVAMDATIIDITEIPEAALWDEAVIQGRQGGEEISVHEIARWKGSVSYDLLTGWRARLPRVYLGGGETA